MKHELAGASKKCAECLKIKPRKEFSLRRAAKDGLQRKCKGCAAIYIKKYTQRTGKKADAVERQRRYRGTEIGRIKRAEWRKAHSGEYYKRYKGSPLWAAAMERRRAKRRQLHLPKIYSQVQRNLEKMPCEKCGAFPAEAHHEDYSRPLDVTWLCKSHHSRRHVELRAQA